MTTETNTLTTIELKNGQWSFFYDTATTKNFTVAGSKRNAPASTSGNRNVSKEQYTMEATRTLNTVTVVEVPAIVAMKMNTQVRDNGQIFNIERPNGDNSNVIIRLN